jgi:hypothetical protein
MALLLAGSPDFAEIYSRFAEPNMPREAAEAAFANLSSAQRLRCQSYLNAHRIRLDNLVFQYQQGLLTDEYYETGVREPLRRFARLWEIAEISLLAFRPSFTAAMREAQENA